MNTTAITWVTSLRGGSKAGRLVADYAFSLAHHKAGNKARSTQGAIRVSLKAMKHLRWLGGDRVLVGFSQDGMDIYIKRVQTGGFALSPVGGKAHMGKLCPCSIKSSSLAFKVEATIAMDDFIVCDDGTVMFTLRDKKEEG